MSGNWVVRCNAKLTKRPGTSCDTFNQLKGLNYTILLSLEHAKEQLKVAVPFKEEAGGEKFKLSHFFVATKKKSYLVFVATSRN